MEDDILEGAVTLYRAYSEDSLDWVSKFLDFRRAIDKSRLDDEYAYYLRASEEGMNTFSIQVPIDRDLRLAGLARVVITTAANVHAIVEMSEAESAALHAEISPELSELNRSAKIAPMAYSKDIMSALIRNVREEGFDRNVARAVVIS